MTLPRALCPSNHDPDPTTCPVNPIGGLSLDIYQPWHENGNVLSYPVNANSDGALAFVPTDLGAWQRPHRDDLAFSSQHCVPNKTNPVLDDCMLPLAPPAQGRWDGSGGTLKVTMDRSTVTSNSRETAKTLSFNEDLAIGYKLGFIGENVSGCTAFAADQTLTMSESSASKMTSTESTEIVVNNLSGDSTHGYFFYPTLYVTRDGTYKVSHASGTDHPVGVTWWKGVYKNADPALNLPLKFRSPGGASCEAAAAAEGDEWTLNPDISAKQMRGFVLRNGNTQSANSGKYLADSPAVHDPSLNNKVLLEARVYNYSVVESAENIEVRFDIVAINDAEEECIDPQQCLTRRPLGNKVTVQCVNPYGTADQTCKTTTSLPPRGIGVAQYTLDISTLGPQSGASQDYRIYVVVDPDNQFPNQTHGWHKSEVVLTPSAATDVNDQYFIDVQVIDGQNTSTETISYTSMGTLSDVLTGLTNNFNASNTHMKYNITATVIDSGSSLIAGQTHIALTTPNAKLKPSTEYRAGFKDMQEREFYFVPRTTAPAGETPPKLTATNDVPGQNNEGWAKLTVFAGTELLGGADPCAAGSLDVYLTDASLAAMDSAGQVRAGQVQVFTGQPVRVRLSVFTNTHSRTFEYVQLFQGHPDDASGQLLALKQVQGVDALKGGHAWHTWMAPRLPGVYTLHARLHERHTDAQPGNNTATLVVHVIDPANPHGPLVSKFRGTARYVGSGQANGTVSLSGTVAFSGTLELSAATLTLSHLLNERNGNGELAQGANGSGFLPLTLLPAPRGGQGTGATFETPDGVEPKVKAEVKQRDPTKGEWELTLTAERTLIDAATGCNGAPHDSTKLTTQLRLDDGIHGPLIMTTTQPWRCWKNRLKAS